MFDGWKEEDQNYAGQGHRRNMLGTGYNAIGIACVTVGGVKYWAMELGRVSSITNPGAALNGSQTVNIEVTDGRVKSSNPSVSASRVYVKPGASAALPTVTSNYTVPSGGSGGNYWNWGGVKSFSGASVPSWVSTDTSIATVSNGKVNGVKDGITTLRATVGGSSVSVTARVSSVNTQTMYRMYNPNSGEHFYTKNVNERDMLTGEGWKYEGIAWTAPATSKTPVYRLYSGTDHHYTTSAGERDALIKAGWKDEGIGWYSDDLKAVPLYRQFNPNVQPWAPINNSGSHNYTTSKAENDQLVSVGWKAEGTGWYGM